MRRTHLISLLASAAATALAATPAAAQEGRPAPATAVEELIVTANKRAENLHEVPMAISAVSEEKLDRTGATNFTEFLTQVPGVNYNAGAQGAGTLTLRGINAGGVAATVGVYVDETPYGSSTALVNASVLAVDINPFDMQRVEVLKGPQGTLYGAGALGGVVKYVSNAPQIGDFAGKVELGSRAVSHGGTGWEAKGMLNLPLGDRVAARITGYYEDRPGFIDDARRPLKDLNTSEIYGGRASILANVTDNLTVRLTANVQNIRNDLANDVDIARPASPSDIRPLFGKLQYTDDVPGRLWPRFRIDYRLYNATVDWDLGFAKLLSSTSYSTIDFLQTFDFTSLINLGDLLGNDVEQEKTTQELRLTSSGDGPLQWLVGYYHTRESGSIHQVLSNPVSGVVHLDQLLPSLYKEDTVFGQVSYQFTPTFDVALGARHAWDRQTGGQFGQSFGTLFTINSKSKESATTYSIAPRWRPNENTTVYGRVASGYLAGGPNVIDVLNSPQNTPTEFGPTKLTNFELGWKQYLLDGRLAFDIAVYHIDWDKIQLLAVTNGVAITANGGKAESDGIEWGVTYVPLEGLTLGWSGAFSEAKLTKDTPPVVGGRKGDPLPRAPEFQTTVTADYEWAISDAMGGFAGATVQYFDKQAGNYITGFPFRQLVLPSYTLINLRGGITTDRFTIQAFVNNIGDKTGYVAIGRHNSRSGGAGAPTNAGFLASSIAPRTVGVSVSASF